jgi:hypothetical protein
MSPNLKNSAEHDRVNVPTTAADSWRDAHKEEADSRHRYGIMWKVE